MADVNVLDVLKARAKTAIKVNKEDHKEDSFKEYIKTSGIHRDAEITEVFETAAKTGAISLTVRFETPTHQGEGTTWTVNKEGKDIQHGKSLFDSLLIVLGKGTAKGTIGKVKVYGAEQDAVIYKSLKGGKVCVATRMEFGMYNDKLTSKSSLRRVFNKAGFSSTELLAGKEEAEAIEKEAKFLKDKYDDGLDEAQVTILQNGGKVDADDTSADDDDGADGFADDDDGRDVPMETSNEMGEDEALGTPPPMLDDEPEAVEAPKKEEPKKEAVMADDKPEKEVVTPEVMPADDMDEDEDEVWE